MDFDMSGIFRQALKMPNTRIKREKYLKSCLSKKFPEDIVRKAIETSPAKAGISRDEMKKFAKQAIATETKRVSSASAVAGLPGGFALVATIPLDLVQYFSHIFRVSQKLAYLYGWDDFSEEENIDDETMNVLIGFIGVMFGVEGANAMVKALANALSAKVTKKVADAALTKYAIYNLVKKILATVGVKVTKEGFAKTIGKAVPVAGIIVSGYLSYYTFKPQAKALDEFLYDLPLADHKFHKINLNASMESV